MKRLRLLGIGFGVAVLALGFVAWSQENPFKPPAYDPSADYAGADKVSPAIRQLMQDRKYDEAVAAIDEAAKAEGAPRDYLAYLKGRALHLAAKYDEAVAAFDVVGKQFPNSPWARRARFGKAVAYMRKGDFRAAEVIYRDEAAYLLSSARRQEIADIYLEFAQLYFKPPKEEQAPDYAKALNFFREALKIGPQPDKKEEVELLVGQCYQNLNQFAEAAAAFAAFVKQYPESKQQIEARFRLGQCQLAQGQLVEARRTWQDLLAAYEKSDHERIAEAAFQLSRTWQIPTPNTDEQLSRGVAALQDFIKRFPNHKLASQAHVNIAQAQVHRGRFADAAASLTRFLADDKYAQSEEIPLGRQLLGQAYQLQKKFPEALQAWREYLTKHPAHQAWSDVQRAIITTEYLQAYEERVAKRYDQARQLFTAFLEKYPLDERAPGVLYLFGQMQYEQEKWEAAIADWRRLVSKYPGTDDASAAQYMIGLVLETKLEKLDEALKEYRKLNWGAHAQVAAMRIAQLIAASLTISTQRVFRSNETPKIKLVARNIEEVTVQAYSVDLETYFRKKHLASDVTGLDIALIDPDQTSKFKLPNYAPHKLIETEVEVPLPAPKGGAAPKSGVMAVTISSKTLEATALVLQSDLDIIVKSSRDEVFVFAENLLTGKPWAGARLLISNGQQVLATGQTGADGVFRGGYEELKSAADVRVFAIADGHVASNVVGLDGVGVAQGLADRGYIYTDRPAYRAGQMVHLRGVIRRAHDDAYVVDRDRKFTVDVFDSRNRTLWQKEIALGAFGTFHTSFLLPPGAAQGQYRVVVSHVEGQSYQGSFLVHEYQLEPVQLLIESDRTVYYRGEEITGKIVARFYYGAPLAGREIRYRLGSDRVYTAKTDEKGEIAFKLATRELAESQIVPLYVELPERNLATARNFVLATQGFSLRVSTVRDLYLSGDTFEAAIKAVDAEGQPLQQKLTLRVVQQTTVEGRVGEQVVQSHEVETGKDGLARATIKIEAGGEYVLRAEGIDRFNNAIFGEGRVRISDENDAVRLRILADQHTFKVGDTAQVQLHWREEPALALVTFEGARVLDYKLVQLQKGANQLSIPMTANLAPNFDLAVAVMVDTRPQKSDQPPPLRFHTAASSFVVERDLQVKIATRRTAGEGPVRPGDEVEVTITTTDGQGQGVSAEVSLAMIEQALLDRFGFNLEAIQDFFRGVHRQAAFRTTSSVGFQSLPETRFINPALLAEEDRLALERDEAARLAQMAQFAAPANLAGGGVGGAQPAAGFGYSTDGTSQALSPPIQAYDDARSTWESRSVGGTAQEQVGGEQIERLQDLLKQVDRDFDGKNLALARNALGEPNSRPESARGTSLGRIVNGRPGASDENAYFAVGQAAMRFSKDLGVQDLEKLRIHSNTVTVFSDNGEQRELNLGLLGDLRGTEGKRLLAQLAQAGAVLLPGSFLNETGYWNPAIVTNEKGQAVVKLVAPDRSTAWKLLAKGVTAQTLAGEAELDLSAKKDFFGELKLPLAFTDGDQAEIVASVHNAAIENAKIDVTLKVTIGEKSTSETRQIQAAKGVTDVAFAAVLKRPANRASGPQVMAELELTISSGNQRQVLRRSVPIEPDGMPVFVTASGSADSDASTFLEPPKEMPLQDPHLQIVVGPTIERGLLDIVLGPAPWCQVYGLRFASGLDVTTSDLMASLGLAKLLKTTQQAGGPDAATLDARIRSSIASLVSSQNDDGGWSWTGRGGPSDRYASARAVWALALARRAGYPVADAAYNSGITYVESQIATTANDDYESKAVLLHVTAAAGRGDFTLANRLYRNRPVLSAAALAYLGLAFAEMDRTPITIELLRPEADKVTSKAPGKEALTALPWNTSEVETRALIGLALQIAAPQSPQAKALADWLMAQRVGHRWSPEKATGPAALAVCEHFANNRFQQENYQLDVFVNDVRVQTLQITDATGTQTIEVPARLLKEGRQRINFQMTGRGRFSYLCSYGGFVATDKLKSTTTEWRVTRTYEPAPREIDGRPLPRGFGILQGNYTVFRNPLTQLPVGQRGHVELRIVRRVPQTKAESREYLVVTEPLPSGATVIEQSVSGDFERFETGPGQITFFVGNRQYATIHYEVHGYLAGAYRAAPTAVRNAYRVDQFTLAEPKSLAVLPAGGKSADEYKYSPQELYELGKRHFEAKQYAPARDHLVQLVNNWNLQPDFYKSAARMLLECYLETGPAAEIVRYFEINIEKWPDEEIPLTMITKVGAAYDDLGEYERSFLVYRAGVEGSFQREGGVAGFLESEGEFTRSVSVMSRLLREYPSEPYIAAASYALAQRVYAKAPEAENDAKLREQKVLRVDLVRQAFDRLNHFVTEHPDDPAADQASFSMGVALLELKKYQDAIAACQSFAQRYPQSDYLDGYWYTIGYCHYALGQHDQALDMCRKVADHKRLDRRTGLESESLNKWRAIYIMGQVYHSLGRAAEAIAEYTRVQERFDDARQAIDYFARKAISLPEVTTIKTGQEAVLPLTYRNVPSADLKVYRIDLMRFSLLKRSLGGITDINLSGIRPSHEENIELGDGKDYRDKERGLKLPLKEEGAYLVVCRGGDLHASGLVLITPLVVEVQEEVSSGQVRATVKDSLADRFVTDVHVKVIGSRNEEFVSGDTDLRGVFMADNIRGTSTVVAQAEGGKYAFYRGTLELGPPPAPAAPPATQPGEPQADSPAQDPGKDKNGLLEGVLEDNRRMQMEQQQELQKLYQQPEPKGVKGGGFFQ
jgi:hypothetical protein